MNTLVATADPNALPLGLLACLGACILILIVGIQIAYRVSKKTRGALYIAGLVALVAGVKFVAPNLFNNQPIDDMTRMFSLIVLLTGPLYFMMGIMVGGMHATTRQSNLDLLEGWQQQLTSDQSSGKDGHVIVADLKAVGACYQRLGQNKDALASFDAAFERLKTTGEHTHPSQLDFLYTYRDLLSSNGRKPQSKEIAAIVEAIPTPLQVSLIPRRS